MRPDKGIVICPQCSHLPEELIQLMRPGHQHCTGCGTQEVELQCWNTKRSFMGKSRCRRPLGRNEGKHCLDCGGSLEAILPYIPKLVCPTPVIPPKPCTCNNPRPINTFACCPVHTVPNPFLKGTNPTGPGA